MDKALLGQEWQTLQNNHEQHERNALLIKLTSLSLCLAGLALAIPLGFIAAVIALCWILEGIFKTYQSRISDRLLRIESCFRQSAASSDALQLHSDWQACRPGTAGLIAGYALSACRPTVTFPYLPLLLILAIGRWMSWL